MAGSGFGAIAKMAAGHHGGPKKLAEIVGAHGHDAKLLNRKDDRFLAGMAQVVFSSGFNWKVIRNKWDGFEEAFYGFNPARVAFFDDDEVAKLLGDTRIVRHGPKIVATVENARFVVDVAKEYGSFSKFLKGWPKDDQVGLLEYLKTRGSRLGGNTGQYFLRFNGWDGFILSRDVVAALIREGVIDKPPGGKAAMRKVQAAFNQWAEESGKSRAEISRTLALSIGPS